MCIIFITSNYICIAYVITLFVMFVYNVVHCAWEPMRVLIGYFVWINGSKNRQNWLLEGSQLRIHVINW